MWSKKFGRVVRLSDVPGRSDILIHSGNLAGDVIKGFNTHSAGCILLGEGRGYLGEQKAVLSSRTAVRKAMDLIMQTPVTPVTVTISEEYR